MHFPLLHYCLLFHYTSLYTMRWLRLSRLALWSLLNNSGLDGHGLLESWLSMSSSSEVPASSILRFPSPRRFIPSCGRHPREPLQWIYLQWTHLQRPLQRMSSTAGDETSRGRNPENGRRRNFGKILYRQSGFQYTYRPRPSSLDSFNKIIVYNVTI